MEVVKETWRPRCYGMFRDYIGPCESCPFRHGCEDRAFERYERMRSKYGEDC